MVRFTGMLTVTNIYGYEGYEIPLPGNVYDWGFAWGKSAQEKKKLIRKFNKDCLILESNHPSPLSAMRGPIPFIGNDHFRKANEWLTQKGISPINWTKHN